MPSSAPRNSYCSSTTPQPTARAVSTRDSDSHGASASHLRETRTSIRRANTTVTPPSHNPFSRLIAAGDLPRSNNPFLRREASGGRRRDGSDYLHRSNATAFRHGPSRRSRTNSESSSNSTVRTGPSEIENEIGMMRRETEEARHNHSSQSSHYSRALIPLQRSQTLFPSRPSVSSRSSTAQLARANSDTSRSSTRTSGSSSQVPSTVVYNVTNINININDHGGDTRGRVAGISKIEVTGAGGPSSHRGDGRSGGTMGRIVCLSDDEDDDGDDDYDLEAKYARTEARLVQAKEKLRAHELKYGSRGY